jgi:ABC-2 type transport system ATP-binding protein
MRALADAGAALVVSSHVIDEAERCDRLVLMRDGAVIAAARLDELLERTGTHDAESAFLAIVEEAGG